ncbi:MULTISPECIES: amidohydrolase [unclassified Dietzia]|uniref:amidohydrolase n=1 Tax=unclassified Dietzia TaxID=2617939 RepID=UPI000D22C851|nr:MULTISPECIES: amidohydrolase [unclassified Dietzia]AVZ39392.1 amidohydrolase [Dietzia sp. JS16-p6b]QGW24657.1 putative TIM-barrel fold metal-dependent hydrolase [Dietzia sp. DQ12-45-1b]
MTALLATGGRVLTPSSRDATALAHEDGLILWAGADAPGPALFPGADRLDLDGDWVAPAFVECLSAGPDLDSAADNGVVTAPVPAPHRLEAVDERIRAGERVVLDGHEDPARIADALTRAAGQVGGPAVARCTPLLIGTDARIDDETLAGLAAVGTVLLLRPLVDDLGGADLVRIVGSGVALAASSRTDDSVRPWDALRALTAVPDGRGLSPRAAFTALTRGARRAAGARDGTAGTLTPGAAATYARWRTGELAVVAADDAVQRWSTDPRSGVPPMPDLSGPDPVLRELVVDGGTTVSPR